MRSDRRKYGNDARTIEPTNERKDPPTSMNTANLRQRGTWAWAIAALLLSCMAPASALYKCMLDGKTGFQELPCAPGARQTIIRSAQEAAEAEPPPPTISVNPIPAPPTTDQDKLDVMESERLRRDAAYALRDKVNELANQQTFCERNFGVIFSRNADANRTISGAVYPQNVNDSAANAAAVRCISKANELQRQLGALRLQCETRKCE